MTKHLLGFGSFPAGSRILDAGCGMGASLQHLQASRLTAVGVDSSVIMLMAARHNYPVVPLICAALERLPFGAGYFDGILCECVLSQTAVGTVLAQFHRVLRENGLLLISDLYRRSVSPRHAAEPAIGSRLTTREQAEAMLQDAGFVVEHWEDRTRDLRQLAARLIMAPGPAGENLFSWKGQGCFGDGAETAIGNRNVGYHLLVARRTA